MRRLLLPVVSERYLVVGSWLFSFVLSWGAVNQKQSWSFDGKVKKRKWLLRYELEEVDWRKEGREAIIAGRGENGCRFCCT